MSQLLVGIKFPSRAHGGTDTRLCTVQCQSVVVVIAIFRYVEQVLHYFVTDENVCHIRIYPCCSCYSWTSEVNGAAACGVEEFAFVLYPYLHYSVDNLCLDGEGDGAYGDLSFLAGGLVVDRDKVVSRWEGLEGEVVDSNSSHCYSVIISTLFFFAQSATFLETSVPFGIEILAMSLALTGRPSWASK